jgi:hypothetical protein
MTPPFDKLFDERMTRFSPNFICKAIFFAGNNALDEYKIRQETAENPHFFTGRKIFLPGIALHACNDLVILLYD